MKKGLIGMGGIVIGFLIWSQMGKPSEEIQRILDFNNEWNFLLTQDSSSTAESAINVNDGDWETIRLPHDWSIAQNYDTVKTDGATGYLPGGIGWYRKTFDQTVSDDQKTFILFDGIYNNADVWINGEKLGFHPYGYSPFYYDITEQLNADGKSNVLAVKVDRSRYVDSRWYSGSGIYRNVKLINTRKLFIPIWGTFITTPEVNTQSTQVRIQIQVINERPNQEAFTVATKIYDQHGEQVAVISENKTLAAQSEEVFISSTSISSPELWSVGAPNMYQAVTTIEQEGEVVDVYETKFGVRDFKFDANNGFFLNGENMKIKGVCLHHDGGLVGAAVPKGVWKRRLETLMDGGVNAVRISHNPASQEFLDLCDELGILVQDEFFDEWDYPKDKRWNQEERHDDYHSRGSADYFQEWAEKDLKSVVLAHRNHPSIFQWSIGNEIEWTYHPRYRNITGYFNMNWKGNYFWELPPLTAEQINERQNEYPPAQYELAKTAQKLADWTRELDTTRPITANCILPSASHVTGYSAALDVVGYSYRRVLYDYGHENYPDKPIMGTENLGQWHEWKAVAERPFISGLFLWTGIDYMGESHNQYPRKATPSGLLDVAGFPKGSFYMMKSLWKEEPIITLATQKEDRSKFKRDPKTGLAVEKRPGAWKHALWFWQDVNYHWNYRADEMIIVEAYSNCEEIELFLNGASLGKRSLEQFEDHIYKWAVPYAEGELVAKGLKSGKEVSTVIKTASAPSELKIKVDDSQLMANQYDVAHVEVQIVDANGESVKTEERRVSFDISGDVRLLGVDNGAADNVQPHASNSIITSQGRAIIIVQANSNASEVTITASSEGLASAEVKLSVVNPSKNKI
ncbi:MAG: DUF4982 domain-containing protein [Cyclobacteriaceae bacterium]